MSDDITILTSEHLKPVTQPPVPGLDREVAFADDRVWVGRVRTEPGMDTGWHHHGTYDTYIYGVSGTVRVEWGPDGARTDEREIGGAFAFIPAGVVHREINPGDTENVVVVIRVGDGGPPVVPVDGPA